MFPELGSIFYDWLLVTGALPTTGTAVRRVGNVGKMPVSTHWLTAYAKSPTRYTQSVSITPFISHHFTRRVLRQLCQQVASILQLTNAALTSDSKYTTQITQRTTPAEQTKTQRCHTKRIPRNS